MGESEMLDPISSTNTSRSASICLTITRQAALFHSSLSLAPIDLFSGVAKTPDRSADGSLAHFNPEQTVEQPYALSS